MKRAQWILRQLDYFLAFYPKQQPKKYISGESHLLLGRQYLLKCLPGNPEHVKLTARQIIVTSRTKRRAKELMHSWYAAKAKERLTDLVNEWIERLSSIQKKPTSILVRTMTKRWGSCTAKGKIILNSELIKAPRGCIDYVIVHELCHLIHHNHTIKFFELQEELFPHWQKWKIRLEHLLA
jgi:hypothetical protein